MASTLSEEQREPIDEFIFRGWTINAVKAIREATRMGIRDAVDRAEGRRRALRESRQGEFVVDGDGADSKGGVAGR